MELSAFALVAGTVLAVTTGGSLGRILDTPLRRPWLLFGAFVLQVAVGLSEPPGAVLWWVVSFLALAAFCGSNLRLTGMSVVALGILLNAFVVVANGGMPVRDPAVAADSAVRVPEDHASTAPWLGEIVPLPGPVERHVTFGDLIVAAGLMDVLFRLSRRPRFRLVGSRADGHAPPVEDALERAQDTRVVQVAGG